MSCPASPDSSYHDFSTYKNVLPPFMENAKKLSSIVISHNLYENTVNIQMDFIGLTNDAHKHWNEVIAGSGGHELPLSRHGKCDGPCGLKIRGEDAVQFGSCDHNVCGSCMEANRRRGTDGTPCCCNEECLRKVSSHQQTTSLTPAFSFSSAVTDDVYQPLCRLRSYRPTFSVLLLVTVRLIFLKNGRIGRKKWQTEIGSNAAMKSIFKQSAAFFDRSQPAEFDWHLITKNKDGRNQLLPMDVEQTWKMATGCFSSSAERIDLVVTKKDAHLLSRDAAKQR